MNVDSSVSSCLVSNDKLNCSGVSPNVHVNDDQGSNSVMPSDVQVSLDIKTNHNVSQILLPLVPVVVNGTYATHALLDNASTNLFCSEKLVNSLGLKRTGTTLNLSTIERSDVNRKMEVVSLTVSGFEEILNMTNVFVTESIPVPNVCTKKVYKHLSNIPVLKSKEVTADILIGQDCSDALIPQEVVKGQRGEPYAVKTLLGSTVSGPYNLDGVQAINVSTNFPMLDKQVEKMLALEN